ncbi:Chromosomal replication initiator protein DnaA [Fundidesulfovibrio magnetotacticus]|uniref:Chromosomal replication initiator protein DnaA n=1 Tax=Fundidesulfovibrio magnetotacticus TaxID=2730080 RepID=A0A6V8LSC3_9BACT|nr:DnaA/Hda family protein [Fundidesulfovibrio magnetotacticus]GFK95372.1 Chromosomal replication initiator protein DnaA [Fundidesulfovibrio magnetotacticus]
MLKKQLRAHLAQFVPEQDLARWYDPLELTPLPDSLDIVVEFPHAYFAQWFVAHARDEFEKHAALYFGPGHVLRYRTPHGGQGSAQGAVPEFVASSIDFPFGHEHTFEQFLTNQKNVFPLTTARDLAKSREVRFNPLVVQGEPGTGKTHLLRCMANELSKHLDRNTLFLGTLDELDALAAQTAQTGPGPLRRYFAGLSAVLLDDLHRLDEFPHLTTHLLSMFNALHAGQRLMVFSTLTPLASCEAVPETLRARLLSGIMVQLSKPDLDVRLRFVTSHCQRKKIPLNKAQMLTLAQRHLDFRTLHGLLNKFQAFRELLKKDISEDIFENILGRGQDERTARTTPQIILEQVAKRFRVDVKALTGPRRTKEISQARQVAMLLCREELGLSYPALGRLFGGKDHSTVLYAVNKIKEIQKDDKVMKELVTELREACRQGGS